MTPTTDAFAPDPRVDAYIAGAAPFAQPLLRELREWVRDAAPQLQETLKWNRPAYVLGSSIVCGFAGFKAHVAFWFWERDPGRPTDAPREGMGRYGKLRTRADLPERDAFVRDLEAALAACAAGTRGGASPRRPPRPVPEVPQDLASQLDIQPEAGAHFRALSDACRREYLEWILEAKRPDTRARRIARAVEQLAAGKSLHWKYQSR